MAYSGRQTIMILILTLFGAGLAQNTWSGLVFGLPDEAAGIGLYVLDFETLMASTPLSGGGQSGGESADFRGIYQKVAPGTLNGDGSL